MRNRQGSHNKLGALGERIARKWLQDNGFLILADNFQVSFGEVDIIAQLGQMVHFVEVKAISYSQKADLAENDRFRPEDHVDRRKIEKLGKVAALWVRQHDYRGDWQLDVASVSIVSSERYAKVDFIENIML